MTTQENPDGRLFEKWLANQRRIGVRYRFLVTIPGSALVAVDNIIAVATLGLWCPGWGLKYMFRAMRWKAVRP